jgi:hypothetical protein
MTSHRFARWQFSLSAPYLAATMISAALFVIGKYVDLRLIAPVHYRSIAIACTHLGGIGSAVSFPLLFLSSAKRK